MPKSVVPLSAQSAAGGSVAAQSVVVVDVMLKPEILDPQGKAVAGALPKFGLDAAAGLAAVRVGKRFELAFDGEVTDELLAQVRGAAEALLANPVIEDFVVRVATPDPNAAGGGAGAAREVTA